MRAELDDGDGRTLYLQPFTLSDRVIPASTLPGTLVLLFWLAVSGVIMLRSQRSDE